MENKELNQKLKLIDLLDIVQVNNSKKDRTQKLGEMLEDEFSELMQKVNTYGKQGSITLKIAIVPDERGERNIIATVDAKPPKGKTIDNVLYSGLKGDLYMFDPLQGRLPLASVTSIEKGQTKNA